MKKVWRAFRTEKETNAREKRSQIRADQLAKLRQLLEIGGHEAEPEYCQLLKDWKPDISNEELAERIRQYHAAVSARQSRDQGLR